MRALGSRRTRHHLAQPQRGSPQPFASLIVDTRDVVGPIVDVGGTMQLATGAQQGGALTADGSTDAISADSVAVEALSVGPQLAAPGAEACIENGGHDLRSNSRRVTATTTVYMTRFISLIGIGTLVGTADAILIDGSTN